MNCKYYKGNQYCNLYKSKVASAYCGDICKERNEMTKEELKYYLKTQNIIL